MHPDLPKLLDVQDKDRRLADAAERLAALGESRASLDAALEAARQQITTLGRGADDAATRRDEREQKLEAQRSLQERRRQRLEQERNPRVAAQLMADVELARSILAQEESEWLRLAEEATQRRNAVGAAEAALQELEITQVDARAQLEAELAEATAAHDAAAAEREASASALDRTLRQRYDRLRRARRKEVLVPASKGTCTACYTAIPRSRIGELQAEGILIQGCEMCGAILYLNEAVA
jgi:predicted  nucleic acid-binding Zn-ribbon protein